KPAGGHRHRPGLEFSRHRDAVGPGNRRLEPRHRDADAARVFGSHAAVAARGDRRAVRALSTIPSIASGLIGVITAYLINTSEDKRTKTIHLFILANAFLLVGAAWNAFFPFNKNLWTSSYVLFTSGIAIHALAIGYWVIDISARKGFTKPFIAFGSNAITAYIISEIVEACLNIIPLGEGVTLKSWVFEHAYASWLNPFAASHLMALTFVLLVYIPVYVLYKKRILIKI
ncbi:MAG TPA: hypothetical protein VLB84_20065, partial [Bacteroidia bacterium]|nr:hypothetical protein [Bacteroidia bacterium]